MKDTAASKAKSPRPGPQSAIPVASAAGQLERQFKVRYYCCMKPQRVYPLTVEVQAGRSGPSAGPSTPILVRPVIPGALVTPAEQRLDATQPGARATFQITPLARRRLPEARVEVLQHGQVADRIGLRMKSVTQFRTWVLAALTLLVPWFLLMITTDRYWKLRGSLPHLPPEVVADPGEVLKHRINTWIDDFVPRIPYSREYVTEPVAHWLGIGYSWACHLAPDHLYFWVGAVLLGLTIVSWIGNRRQRASRRKLLQLGPPVEAGETLALGERPV
ncbi:MAG TPA: hypothetical protein VNK04_12985 [Gemmataceae bacterium]|nr:hypothetical protein [Gemmataceae bacterium]